MTFRAVLIQRAYADARAEHGICHGCLRSNAEIARWLQMDDDERLRLMETVLPAREAGRT